jgi:hypothetical protein
VGGKPGEFTDLEGRGIAACFATFEQFSPGMSFADFERLETDFSHVLVRLGLQGRLAYRQPSPRRLNFRSFYTRATAEAVAQRYAEDLDRFDYRRDAP